MEKANISGFFKGILNENISHGPNMLQYAYDTLSFIQDDVESVKNLKFIFSVFDQMSGLTINFHKVNYFYLEKLKEK